MPLGADSRRTPSEQALLDGLSGRDVMEFRNFIHSPAYIRVSAGILLNNDWIIISELADWLLTRNVRTPSRLRVRSPRFLERHDVVEILSDSEDGYLADPGQDSDFEFSETLLRGASRSSSILTFDSDDLDPPSHTDDEPALEQSDMPLLLFSLSTRKSIRKQARFIRWTGLSRIIASKATGRASGARPPSVIVSSSSTGRVKTVPVRAPRRIQPQPIQAVISMSETPSVPTSLTLNTRGEADRDVSF
ncbi:hypothetical protein C8R43DRAFT_1230903 [Mycena crocata]|nr:hypothetical protein C8R43DRAFT_1230903 [Mycena crocata]